MSFEKHLLAAVSVIKESGYSVVMNQSLPTVEILKNWESVQFLQGGDAELFVNEYYKINMDYPTIDFNDIALYLAYGWI